MEEFQAFSFLLKQVQSWGDKFPQGYEPSGLPTRESHFYASLPLMEHEQDLLATLFVSHVLIGKLNLKQLNQQKNGSEREKLPEFIIIFTRISEFEGITW